MNLHFDVSDSKDFSSIYRLLRWESPCFQCRDKTVLGVAVTRHASAINWLLISRSTYTPSDTYDHTSGTGEGWRFADFSFHHSAEWENDNSSIAGQVNLHLKGSGCYVFTEFCNRTPISETSPLWNKDLRTVFISLRKSGGLLISGKLGWPILA